MSEEYRGCDNCKNFDVYEWSEPCEHCTHNMVDGDEGVFTDNWTPMDTDPSQTAKADAGKAQLTMVPRRIIWDIARVREYGNAKYGSPDNWKTVEPQRYRDAAFRHFLAYLDDPDGVDEESGIKHLHHLACNIAFLCEMEDKE